MFSKKKHIAELKAKCQELEKMHRNQETEARNAGCEVAFEKINAVSIDREINNGVSVTIVSYLLPGTDKLRDSFFQCSQETHERLVKEFKTYRDNKTSTL